MYSVGLRVLCSVSPRLSRSHPRRLSVLVAVDEQLPQQFGSAFALQKVSNDGMPVGGSRDSGSVARALELLGGALGMHDVEE